MVGRSRRSSASKMSRGRRSQNVAMDPGMEPWFCEESLDLARNETGEPFAALHSDMICILCRLDAGRLEGLGARPEHPHATQEANASLETET